MTRTHPGRFHIAIPGPTNIPERILNAMHISSEDQRNPEIPNLTIPLYKDVKKVFKSENGTVFLFPGSGTRFLHHYLSNHPSSGTYGSISCIVISILLSYHSHFAVSISHKTLMKLTVIITMIIHQFFFHLE